MVLSTEGAVTSLRALGAFGKSQAGWRLLRSLAAGKEGVPEERGHVRRQVLLPG